MYNIYISNIIQGVIGGIFTSFVLYIFLKIRDYYANRKGLKELFNYNKFENYNIILASIYADRIKGIKKSNRYINAKIDIPYFAKNDVKAAALIYNLMNIYCENVKINNDEDCKYSKDKNLISIGGSSNDITWKILSECKTSIHYLRYKNSDLNTIKMNPNEHYYKYINIACEFEEALYDYENAVIYKQDDKYTYSLILKMNINKHNEGVVQYIISGLSSIATYSAAKYFCKNWKKIRRDIIFQQHAKFKLLYLIKFFIVRWESPSFAIILKLNRKDNSVDKICLVKVLT
jgi:hypothetical protein